MISPLLVPHVQGVRGRTQGDAPTQIGRRWSLQTHDAPTLVKILHVELDKVEFKSGNYYQVGGVRIDGINGKLGMEGPVEGVEDIP